MVLNFTVLLAVVLIGYVFLSRSNYYKPRLVTLSNYALLYESALAGAVIFAVAWSLILLVKIYGSSCSLDAVIRTNECWIDAWYPLPHLDVLLVSSLLALLMVWIGNKLRSSTEVAEELARQSGFSANLILDALNEYHLLQITTIRNKVYVGWLSIGPGISAQGNILDLAVVPLFSGHRDPFTQKMVLDIAYAAALEKQLLNGLTRRTAANNSLETSLQELSVVIPTNEILLIRRHTMDLHEVFTDSGVLNEI